VSAARAFRRIRRPDRYDVVLPVLAVILWLLADWFVAFRLSAAWFLGVLIWEWFKLRRDVAAAVAEAMHARGIPADLIARWRFLEVRKEHVPAPPRRSRRSARAHPPGQITPGRFTP
jgi:hypothetical protein